MKKFLSIGLVVALAISLAACGDTTSTTTETSVSTETSTSVDTPASTDTSVEENKEPATGAVEVAVMTYADYVAANVDDEVIFNCYVQATQSWWDGKISVYAADADGAYFIYNMACTEEDAAKLVPGTEITVTGFKAEWAGEVEVAEGATFQFVEGGDSFVAEAKDVTEYIGTDDMATFMNQLVSFTDMTVEAVSYKNNEPGDDIYVTLSKNDTKVEFCLEYYLNGSDEEFYNTVGNLEAGATVDVTAYLYWYEGPDGHLTSVTVK